MIEILGDLFGFFEDKVVGFILMCLFYIELKRWYVKSKLLVVVINKVLKCWL